MPKPFTMFYGFVVFIYIICFFPRISSLTLPQSHPLALRAFNTGSLSSFASLPLLFLLLHVVCVVMCCVAECATTLPEKSLFVLDILF